MVNISYKVERLLGVGVREYHQILVSTEPFSPNMWSPLSPDMGKGAGSVLFPAQWNNMMVELDGSKLHKEFSEYMERGLGIFTGPAVWFLMQHVSGGVHLQMLWNSEQCIDRQGKCWWGGYWFVSYWFSPVSHLASSLEWADWTGNWGIWYGEELPWTPRLFLAS